MDEISSAQQDAVKAIYLLTARGGDTTTADVARELAVTAPSASTMVGRLVAAGLARRGAGRRIGLTAAGENAALRVVRRQRLVETFLARELHLSWDELHEEAERLEHAISERVADALDARLGHPDVDPHGDPIPRSGRAHNEAWGDSLGDLPPGAGLRVERVRDQHAEALRHLAGIGVLPGIVVRVERRGPFGEPVWIRVAGTSHPLGAATAGLVHGRRLALQAVPEQVAR